MVLKILLLISVVFQLSAAAIAIRLTRVTKYNVAWMLVTIALTLMAVMRMLEYGQMLGRDYAIPEEVFVWMGVMTSLCFAAGIFYIRKILNYIALMENKRRNYENRILNTIIQTEEKERERFSKEIHDGLGPLISSVKMSISALDHINTDPRQKEIITNTRNVIDEAVRELKEISNNLNPHVLMNFGLVRAVGNFINKLFTDTDIQLKTNLKEKRFDRNLEAVLYRVICEMINNSLKHARARRIDIDLRLKNDEITLTFEDDGIGFEPSEVIDRPDGGMGLSNIASRISSVKGEIEVFSKPGLGTTITVKVNIKDQ